ncbi:MAG: efflux RND transporter periplasmic adaptor subunit [Planctomycetia bacterium]|nr:efflux RND transporter periplasmic adaptor subunit [Planctomycetia bacterium]
MSPPHVDLSQLAMRRDEPALPRPSRSLLTRYLLPGVVLLGFAGLVAWAGRDSLMSARSVTVVPVVATRAVVQQGGAPLFTAAGWIEPRPTPVLVPALAEGVVAELLVVEGQEVQAGQPVAKLVAADAQLALTAADADHRHREAEADTLLAKAETDLLYLPFQTQAAEASLKLAQSDYTGKKSAEGTIPALTVQRAESELSAARIRVEELKVRKQRLEREVHSLRHMRDAFRKGQDWQKGIPDPPTDTEAGMKAALTRCWQAQLAVDAAKLRLERMVVRAPTAGRVLALIARPGSRLMVQGGGNHESGAVVSIYDPKMLQVRADVRFEDLPQVQPSQPVRIESPAIAGAPAAGKVLFATSVADVQKNTLQVKVAVENPPSLLKPDMLVQVTFIAPPRAEAAESVTETMRLLVPRPLVDGESKIWVADQTAQVARLRPVKLGRPINAEQVEVLEGLNPADKLIVGGRDGLTDGQRIVITGEDATLGVSAPVGGSKAPKVKRLQGEHENKH